MKLYCPHCGVKGSADDSYRGRKIKCPKCETIFKLQQEMALNTDKASTESPALSLKEKEASPEFDFGTEIDGQEPAIAKEWEAEADEFKEESEETFGFDDISLESEGREDDELSDLSEELSDQIEDIADAEMEELELSTLLSDEVEQEELEYEEMMKNAGASFQQKSAQASSLAELTAVGEIEDVDDLEDVQEIAEELNEVEQEPYGVDKEQCWECGKKDSAGEPFIAKDGRLYCMDCLPEEEAGEEAADDIAFATGVEGGESPPNVSGSNFTIGQVIREAWKKTKGAKGSIWGGSAFMYLVILLLAASGAYFLPRVIGQSASLSDYITNGVFLAVAGGIMALFSAGLLYMGVRKAAGYSINWKMIFRGFNCAGKVIIASILQSIFVIIGCLFLVLPGIYLAVGYAMTLPLIVDKDMSPWQAMETSRKAIHKVWWKIAGLFLVLVIIFLVSLIFLGIGLIWTWPMFIITGGVVYSHLFGRKTNHA